MFLSYVHSFRAVAIVLIVGNHALWIFDWRLDDFTRNVLVDVLDGSTELFVFVAGFLFHHLSHAYEYRSHLVKKFKNVVLPYIVMSSPSVLDGALNPRLYGQYPQLTGTSAAFRLGWFLVHGGAGMNRSLWFISTIVLFYLAAPLFILFVRYPRLFGVLVVLVPFSLLAHRGAYPNLQFVQLALYFAPAYVLGMWASHQRSRLEPWVARWWPLLLGAWGLATTAMAVFSEHHGNYEGAHLFSQEHGPIDWMFAQKLLLCFALLGLMRRFEKQTGPSLEFLGAASFAVFFVHYYFVVAIRHVLLALDGLAEPTDFATGSLASWAIGFAVVLALSVGTVTALRRVLGRRSRYVIGA